MSNNNENERTQTDVCNAIKRKSYHIVWFRLKWADIENSTYIYVCNMDWNQWNFVCNTWISLSIWSSFTLNQFHIPWALYIERDFFLFHFSLEFHIIIISILIDAQITDIFARHYFFSVWFKLRAILVKWKLLADDSALFPLKKERKILLTHVWTLSIIITKSPPCVIVTEFFWRHISRFWISTCMDWSILYIRV